MIKTIFLDMDGTLLDTEKYYTVCWKQACAFFGYDLKQQDMLDLRSLGRPFAPAFFKELFGEEADYVAIREKRKELMAEMLKTKAIEAKPYAVEALTLLKEKGYRLAIVTATNPVRARAHLEEAGLLKFFDEIVSSTMVKQGKPAPDTYLLALEKLGVKAEETAAVEDSDNGVLSASRAGLRVAMIPDLSELKEENKSCAYKIMDDLLEFAKDVQNW